MNYRGTHESEGVWRGYRGLQWGELRDGYDVCEWLAAQPWCTGKIGTYGGSQAGYAQNYLAVTQPPHLVAQYMTDTGLSLYQEGYRIGGVTRPERFKAMGNVARDPADNDALLREWDQHPDFDDYWRDEDCTRALRQDECAVLHDRQLVRLHGPRLDRELTSAGSSTAAKTRAASSTSCSARGCTAAIRNRTRSANSSSRRTPMFDVYAHMTRWFNHYLKGEDNGVEKEPPVRYYVMGAAGEAGAPGNFWREAQDFPPQGRERLFLSTTRRGARAEPLG